MLPEVRMARILDAISSHRAGRCNVKNLASRFALGASIAVEGLQDVPES